MTFFPSNWNFQDAIDSNLCESPSTEFPTGIYDVTIRPWLIDEAVYVRYSDDFHMSQDGSYSKRVQISECTENFSCLFAEYVLIDVAVSSNLNPAKDVENSMLLVENAQSFIDGEIFWILLILFSLFLLVAIYSLNKIKRNYKPTISEESEDEDEGIAELDKTWSWSKTLTNIMEEFDIHDKDAFLNHAMKFDYDNNNKYLSSSELSDAAEDWNKLKMDLDKSILKEKVTPKEELAADIAVNNTEAKKAKADNDGDSDETTSDVDLSSLKVAELKELLKTAGKPVGGKKADLIARLSEWVDDEDSEDDDAEIEVGSKVGVDHEGEEWYGEIIEFDEDDDEVLVKDDDSGEEYWVPFDALFMD